jgi:hypothetical protein
MLRAISLSACVLFASCAADGDQSAADAGDSGGGVREAGVRDFGVPDADFTGQICSSSKIRTNDAGPQTSYAVTPAASQSRRTKSVDHTPLLILRRLSRDQCVRARPINPTAACARTPDRHHGWSIRSAGHRTRRPISTVASLRLGAVCWRRDASPTRRASASRVQAQVVAPVARR